MIKAILSEEEFLKVLSVGDKFWFINSIMGSGPICIEGPCIIDEIKREKSGDKILIRVFFKQKICIGTLQEEVVETDRAVSDLTNRWHGVFLSKEDARKYFLVRKHAYKTDPKLIRELRKERKFLREMPKPGEEDQYEMEYEA